jgi:hypothetical protein
LLSVICAVSVFGVLVFSASASEATTTEEEVGPAFWGFHDSWHDLLTDEQLATLKEVIEENRAEVKEQLEAWGAEMFELDDEQREQLKAMMDENHAEVQALLEEWGIEVPEWEGPMGLRGNLTDEQLEELETMRQDYLDSVKAKLEEWGVEVPEIAGPSGFGMRLPRSGARGFSPFKP